jgi:chromosome partitioning protein
MANNMLRSKVITIAQQKGGAGKTTLAAHIAIALNQKQNRVSMVDIDPQSSLKHWFNIRAQRFGDDYTGIHFTATAGWKINTEILNLRNKFDYIIIDSPPHTETDAKAAIRAADLLIIPIQPSPTDFWATKATIDLAKKEKIPYMVVLNRVTPNSKLAEGIRKQLDNVSSKFLSNRVAFASCMLEGKCVTETQPKGPAAAEIKALVNEILKRFPKEAEKEAA